MKKIDFPDLRQTYEYDCGPKVLQSVLVYYGINLRQELLIKKAGTSKLEGTSIKSMLNVLNHYKLKTDSGIMNIKKIKKYVKKNVPVILLLQAWSTKKIDYSKSFNFGHWVVAIGYNKNKIIFEDPYSFNRTFLTHKELNLRWHGKDNGKKFFNYGIAVYGKKPEYKSKKIIPMN